MWREVMRPKPLRPPVLGLPSVSILTGAPFHSWPRSTSTSWRSPGLVGRYVLSAMGASLEPRRHVDGVPLLEGHDGALGVALAGGDPPERLHLGLAHLGIAGLHLHAEQRLDGSLDLRLGGVARHLEDDLVVFRHQRRFLGDGRRADEVVRVFLLAYLKRASSASSAALVCTSRLRRRMS